MHIPPSHLLCLIPPLAPTILMVKSTALGQPFKDAYLTPLAMVLNPALQPDPSLGLRGFLPSLLSLEYCLLHTWNPIQLG